MNGLKYISMILALLTGSILGFFGVLVSVFADGSFTERMTTIGVILMVYALLSAMWAYFQPKYSWSWGLIVGLPGIMLLGLYILSQFNPYYLLYMVMIMAIACLGAFGGSYLSSRRKQLFN